MIMFPWMDGDKPRGTAPAAPVATTDITVGIPAYWDKEILASNAAVDIQVQTYPRDWLVTSMRERLIEAAKELAVTRKTNVFLIVDSLSRGKMPEGMPILLGSVNASGHVMHGFWGV